jgi:hypothetical protein
MRVAFKEGVIDLGFWPERWGAPIGAWYPINQAIARETRRETRLPRRFLRSMIEASRTTKA